MKTEKYYTNEDFKSMTVDTLRELVRKQQDELQALRWRVDDVKELLIAALQALPKTMEL